MSHKYERWKGDYCMDIKLNTKIILEKEFKTNMRGYSQEQVDLFLDDVIQDYKVFQQKIEELEIENKRLRDEVEQSQNRPVARTNGATNFDLLKRITNLENHVFGSKLTNHE